MASCSPITSRSSPAFLDCHHTAFDFLVSIPVAAVAAVAFLRIDLAGFSAVEYFYVLLVESQVPAYLRTFSVQHRIVPHITPILPTYRAKPTINARKNI